MRNIHRRIVQITHFDNMPVFKTEKEVKDWYEMIGRLATYMQPENYRDTVQYVDIYVRDKDEVTACYYKAEESHTYHKDGRTDWDKPQPEADLFNFVNKTIDRTGHPFVIGAVLMDGMWGFHS